jgi:hypothetical protein
VDGPTWPSVALAFVNGAQMVMLAYLAQQQARSSRERIKRSTLEEAGRLLRPAPTREECDRLERIDPAQD